MSLSLGDFEAFRKKTVKMSELPGVRSQPRNNDRINTNIFDKISAHNLVKLVKTMHIYIEHITPKPIMQR